MCIKIYKAYFAHTKLAVLCELCEAIAMNGRRKVTYIYIKINKFLYVYISLFLVRFVWFDVCAAVEKERERIRNKAESICGSKNNIKRY